MSKLHKTEVTVGQLAVAASFAIEALIYCSPEVGWSDHEKAVAKGIRGYPRKLWGTNCRMVVDRFAFFCSEMRLDYQTRAEIWPLVFSLPNPYEALEDALEDAP
jgi:hypothetical protein